MSQSLRWPAYWLVVALLVLALLGAALWWGHKVRRAPTSVPESSSEWTVGTYGTFGDAIAPITALATILTFGVAIAGLLLQRIDIAAAAKGQEELAEKQKEILDAERQTANALGEQVEVMRQQLAAVAKQQAEGEAHNSKILEAYGVLAQEQARSATALAAAADAQRLAALLHIHQAKRALLVEVREHIIDMHESMLKLSEHWLTLLNRISDRSVVDPLMRAVGSFQSTRLVGLRNDAGNLSSWIAAHDKAVPGTEVDRSEEISAVRARSAECSNALLELTGSVAPVVGPVKSTDLE